ncbi:MAG TPA: metalloprotease PmbA [Pelomicrobium sp.]|nr:metalloprotease PmbA [Pelomicrobium sp.]
MTDQRFSHTAEELAAIAAQALDFARAAGATACETEVSIGFGQSVTVRLSDVETIEYNRDKGLGITVYVGRQRGHAGTSDFSRDALKQTAEAAVAIARHTAADECAGLADRELLAREVPDLDLYHPWNLPVEQAIELAKQAEGAAMAVDPRIANSEGATVSVHEARFVYANSSGFSGGYPTSRHSVSCAVIGGEGDAMQRDYWYSTARVPAELEPADEVGRRAGRRTAERLGARKIATAQVPVIFEAPLASSLIGHFVHAASGGSLYRRASFLVDRLGERVFSDAVTIRERPHLPRGLGSAPFDDEGVATRDRDVVAGGTLSGYFLGSYSARKLKMRTTGNAGGNHNLLVESGSRDLPGLLREMGTGLLVTELLGHGVNIVTGDYSRGAAGYWVENGEIAYPVQEITIAGNLAEMFRGVVAVGTDVVVRGSKQCGSILVDRMTVAGD